MNKKRPVNLDLSSLSFPPMAIVSILHRVSGVFLILLLPLMMFFLSQSLQSESLFVQTKEMLTNPYYKVLLWLFSSAFTYHVLAGLRHLLMDMGFGEQLPAGRNSAILVLILFVIAAFVLGIWIW